MISHLYTCTNFFALYVMQFEKSGGPAFGIGNAFKEDSVSAAQMSLQWQSNLDYIYANSATNVSLIVLHKSLYILLFIGCADTSRGVFYEQGLL